MDYKDEFEPHSIFWWNIKILCSLILILGVFLNYLTDWYPTIFSVNNSAPSILVLLGGAVFFYHYYLIKRQNKKIDKPVNLITSGGLFKYIRHPMYFSDVIMFLGFTLMACNILSLAVFIVSIIALVKQSKVEDKYLSDKYPSEHEIWVRSTRLLLPGVY